MLMLKWLSLIGDALSGLCEIILNFLLFCDRNISSLMLSLKWYFIWFFSSKIFRITKHTADICDDEDTTALYEKHCSQMKLHSAATIFWCIVVNYCHWLFIAKFKESPSSLTYTGIIHIWKLTITEYKFIKRIWNKMTSNLSQKVLGKDKVEYRWEVSSLWWSE